ncbi:MAG: class I SAM-dependent methyltransferase [Schleiferiaceae bacterium]|jgi:16S rRNA G966 N2-methylase RsmD|nr:class I SAM-dependent methyltransferase [Schleiferiaceae bacterium]
MFSTEDLAALSSSEAKEFIELNLKARPEKLRLKYSKKKDLPYSLLINQVEARQRLQKKNPTWVGHEKLVFPPKLNLEQSSSDKTGKYKSSITSGHSLIDITGGMGVDTFFLSQNFKESTYCEISKDLCVLAEHNFKVLKAPIKVENTNGLEYLDSIPSKFDLIYVDPARRKEGQRIVSLHDCIPNVVEHQDLLLKKGDAILIKASPLLDINLVLNELKSCLEVHIVSVNNECKELLFLLKPDYNGSVVLKAINFDKEKVHSLQSSKGTRELYADPEVYLYEPNSSIMKGRMFSEVCHEFDLKKIAPHSNLFTSQNYISNFHGKSFKIMDIQKPFKQSYKKEYLNIVSRNFNLKPEAIKKRLKSIDGGARFLFATTLLSGQKAFILAERLD